MQPSNPKTNSNNKAKNKLIYASGVAQGIVLVTFPAASTIFISRSGYDLSSTQYGLMFVPQVITGIVSSLSGTKLSNIFSIKIVYLIGLFASFIAMTTLILSLFSSYSLKYSLLLIATGFIGIGFGLSVPALNTFTASFHPQNVDSSVLILNALLGLGTALAPAFIAVFIGLGFWWGLPALSAILLAVLFVAALGLDLAIASNKSSGEKSKTKIKIPARFWLYASFAILYGISETMNGNWAQVTMSHLGGSNITAAIALASFWSMVTIGRIVFATLHKLIPPHWTYRLLPFVVMGTFLYISMLLGTHSTIQGVIAFALAGLGCSALLPLSISFGQEQESAISSSIAGGIIAFYQLGYGIAAFGVGPIQSLGIPLAQIFKLSAIVALLMGIISFAITHRPSHPPALHPIISLTKAIP